jgi:hypothetical protein
MNEIFKEALSDLEERLSKLGVYVTSSEFGAVPASEDLYEEMLDVESFNPEESFMNGNIKLYVSTFCSFGDIAFSDRILNPDSYNEKKQFDLIVPTESEIALESLKDDLLDWND